MRKTITDLPSRDRAMRFVAALVILSFQAAGAATAQDSQLARGEYLLHAGGCISCHTADEEGAAPLAGGLAMETPYGTFFTPNITPDDETGIGGWSDEEFLDALWSGIRPDGSRYYPAFPYPAYTGASQEDLLAIKAYLSNIEPVRRPNQKNDLRWYLTSRVAARAWQTMNFEPGRFKEDPDKSAEWNRGAYLVRHLGHCGECHTPRSKTGKLLTDQEMRGNPDGPDDKKVPGITQDREDGIGRWSMGEIEFFLEIGMLPDGDFTGSKMSQVIDDNTSHLTGEDRNAIAVYLKSLKNTKDEKQ